MAVTTNLYPPIVETYMPAFLVGSEDTEKNICRIYFSLSMFNNLNQIKNVQVSLRNQSTNLSALNPKLYPSEIMITNILEDVNINTANKYYIEIKPSDIINNNFIIDQYYKVQLRFTNTDVSEVPFQEGEPQAIDAWLSENLLNFSEWSTVVLIRGISTPTINLKDFDFGMTTDIMSEIGYLQIVGNVSFADPNETETLKSYRITMQDNTSNDILFDTGNIFTSNFANVNGINYVVDYNFQVGLTYIFELEITTENLFTYKDVFYIYINQGQTEPINLNIGTEIDEENGRIKVNIVNTPEFENFTGQVVIRRSDSKNNFTTWADLYVVNYNDINSLKLGWYDYTVESGILYLYAVQTINEQGVRSSMVRTEEPILLVFENIFLTYQDKQLKLKFNPQISTFKRNISESKIDTIGSQFPFIKRNGYVNYLQFSISALIASAMDEEGLFLTREEVYGENSLYYNDYNDNNRITKYNDFIYEKFFRDKVMDFLYEDNVKLFRSPTEGNIIVRLMDTQLQPNQSLGRRIWSFTSNIYEIDNYSMENLDKYNLIIKDNVKPIEEGSLDIIKRIVIINNKNEFPDEGQVNVLYIYNKQLYIWESLTRQYNIISIPFWGQDPEIEIISNIGKMVNNGVYTNGKYLYQWDAPTQSLNIISEPTYNLDYKEDE